MSSVQDQKDSEASIRSITTDSSDQKEKHDHSLITWENDSDAANPKNWSNGRKWLITAILSGFSVLPPLSSTIIAPAQFAIRQDLGIDDPVVLQICLSIFNVGIGLGPLIMGPLSETYGRYPVVLLGSVFFLAWNTGCGFASSEATFIVCRLFTGLGSTASLSVMGATMGDIWPAEKRATAIGMATFFPLLGPAIGPIVGGYVTQYASWRWILWASSIANAVWLLLGAVCLRETYAPRLLRKKALHLRKTTGDATLHSAFDHQSANLLNRLRGSLFKPLRILSTQTVIQIICIVLVATYGTMFLNFYSFPTLWTDVYHESTATGSLNYISTALGLTIGSQVFSRLNDLIYRAFKRRNNDQGSPELRLPLLLVCSSLLGVGLVIFGWTAQFRTHWIAPNIGNVLFLAGSIGLSQMVSVYTVDAYVIYAASALSTENFVRSMASFAFPLFAPAMYAKLGWGGASTLLGMGTTVVALVAGGLLWKYGAKLRERQKVLL